MVSVLSAEQFTANSNTGNATTIEKKNFLNF